MPTATSVRTACFLALVAACARAPEPMSARPAPTASASSSVGVVASASASASAPVAPIAVDVSPTRPATLGSDAATTETSMRKRVPTAVVLLGSPDIVARKTMRFQPVACSIGGVLTGGLACSQAMPPSAIVRLTHSAPSTPHTTTLRRVQRGYKDEAGGRTYAAPLEPSCCMYNTCVGETHAFLPSAALAPSPIVVAIWPADADIELELRGGVVGNYPVKVAQAFRVGSRTVVNAFTVGWAQFATDDGTGLAWIDLFDSARQVDVLATMDLDHDGHAEALVYETWANDFGFTVLGNQWKAPPLYRFSCGNI